MQNKLMKLTPSGWKKDFMLLEICKENYYQHLHLLNLQAGFDKQERERDMKAVIAIDSFKGSLTSLQAGSAAEEGIKKVYPDAEIFVRPVADGGEGTVDTLVSGLQGEKHTVNVTGPLGEPVLAEYGIIDNHTAVIEMSAAAGITLVSPEKRNPLYTTTYGVGEIIIDAIKKNCRNFIIGIGGSATNDGGIGMLQALGYEMLDQKESRFPLEQEGWRGYAQLLVTTFCLNLKTAPLISLVMLLIPFAGKMVAVQFTDRKRVQTKK